MQNDIKPVKCLHAHCPATYPLDLAPDVGLGIERRQAEGEAEQEDEFPVVYDRHSLNFISRA